jgi:hypothetical protein
MQISQLLLMFSKISGIITILGLLGWSFKTSNVVSIHLNKGEE